jgi:uncharacterized protein
MTKPFVGWFEITGRDGPALQRFYSKLFDWSINDAGDGSGYGLVEAGDNGIAGGVTSYIEAGDPAALLESAEKPGGKTLIPPTEMLDPGLTVAFFADPEGHVAGLSGGAAP